MIDAAQIFDLEVGFHLHGITCPEEQRELVRQATGGDVRALTQPEADRLIRALREMPRIANTTPPQTFSPLPEMWAPTFGDDDDEAF